MSLYQVRPAVARDAAAIAAIHVNTWQEAYEGLLPEADLKAISVDKRLKFWREAIQYGDPQVHVAVDDDRIVGFVGFDRSRDPKSKPTTGEIWAIYVGPGDWDQGAGLALWDAARERRPGGLPGANGREPVYSRRSASMWSRPAARDAG